MYFICIYLCTRWAPSLPLLQGSLWPVSRPSPCGQRWPSPWTAGCCSSRHPSHGRDSQSLSSPKYGESCWFCDPPFWSPRKSIFSQQVFLRTGELTTPSKQWKYFANWGGCINHIREGMEFHQCNPIYPTGTTKQSYSTQRDWFCPQGWSPLEFEMGLLPISNDLADYIVQGKGWRLLPKTGFFWVLQMLPRQEQQVWMLWDRNLFPRWWGWCASWWCWRCSKWRTRRGLWLRQRTSPHQRWPRVLPWLVCSSCLGEEVGLRLLLEQ